MELIIKGLISCTIYDLKQHIPAYCLKQSTEDQQHFSLNLSGFMSEDPMTLFPTK